MPTSDRPLADEPPEVLITDVRRGQADDELADALAIERGGRIIQRISELRGGQSKEPWGLGIVTYPAGELPEDRAELLLVPGEITYDEIEAAFGRRIIGYRERLIARAATREERAVLQLPAGRPVIEVIRTARTTTTPISDFRFIARSDRFEADYILPS